MEADASVADGKLVKFAPTYVAIPSEGHAPGPRCGHTLTSVAPVGEPDTPGYVGSKLILFGAATALEGGIGAATGEVAGFREYSFSLANIRANSLESTASARTVL